MYNRWRNGTPNRAYKAVWLPSQKHELYHYGVRGMKWRYHKEGQAASQGVSSGGSGELNESNELASKDQNTNSSKWSIGSIRDAVKKILEKLKGSSKPNRPRSRKRNPQGGGTGVHIRDKSKKIQKIGSTRYL